MRVHAVAVGVFAVLAVVGPAAAGPTSRAIATGGVVYTFSCASCHGYGAGGDDAQPSDRTSSTPDLTGLTQRNGGTFPEEHVRLVITGGAEETSHAGQMPAWGPVFLREYSEFTFDTSEGDSERVERRINDVIAFLRSIQVAHP